ncbi:hypothetical protein RhiLY_00992 [Ceratobasidium sp. AG-Ba]|nr:hypothetical protein RhiLY_00992 [Ceratobasidium sp. AG-Ba]
MTARFELAVQDIADGEPSDNALAKSLQMIVKSAALGKLKIKSTHQVEASIGQLHEHGDLIALDKVNRLKSDREEPYLEEHEVSIALGTQSTRAVDLPMPPLDAKRCQRASSVLSISGREFTVAVENELSA